jgi:serine protease Do
MKEKEKKAKKTEIKTPKIAPAEPVASLDADIVEETGSNTPVFEEKTLPQEIAPKPETAVLTADFRAEQDKRNSKGLGLIWVVTISLLVGLSAGVFGSVFVAPWLQQTVIGSSSGGSTEIKKVTLDENSAVIDVVKAANPAVVSIIVSKDLPKVQQYLSPFSDGDFNNNPFGYVLPGETGTEKQQIGAGSGFIVTSDGMIMTNKHVVSDDKAEYTVITSDGKTYTGRVLAKDPMNDLAIVKIDAKDLITLSFGNSDELVLGQGVIAIGNTLGQFSNTVTTGVVSGIGRTVSAGSGFGAVEQLQQVIQTDAAINPGNSGGPLLNLAGQVIGVNTAIDQSGQLVGFAIPSSEAKKVLDDVRQSGRVLRPFMGVRYVIVNADYAKQNKLSVDYGALIIAGDVAGESAVVAGSPAEKAGLKENDVILEINGKRVDESNPLAKLIKSYKPGDQVVLKIQRGKETKELIMTLGEAKEGA